MKKYILILTAIAVLASCGKDMGSPSGGLPMRLDASLTATKASLTTADLQEFWLQVDCPSDASYSFFGKVSRSGTAWSAGRQLWWRDETTPVYYTAAFFSGHDFTGAEFTGGVDLAVPSDQSTQALLNAADLLTLKATSTSYEATAGGTLPVELGHALTKVNFELTLGASFYDNFIGIAGNPVTAFTVSGAMLGFGFQPATGAVSAIVGTEADITPFASEYTPETAVSDERAKAIFEAVLVPQDIAAGQMKVSFRIGTVEYEWSNATALTLPAGQTVTLPLSAPAVPTVNGYAYVDMGLSVKWATMNVGATKATERGDHFAWGETEPKQKSPWYDWSSYVFNQGTDWSGPFSKYVTDDSYGAVISYGTPDNKTSLDPEDDAAHVKWGGTWRMPTEAEWAELENNCNFVYTEHGQAYGVLFTSKKNGNSIFLPLGGYKDGSTWEGFGRWGSSYYWSSSLVTDSPCRAWSFCYYHNTYIADFYRNRGHSVRPVTE